MTWAWVWTLDVVRAVTGDWIGNGTEAGNGNGAVTGDGVGPREGAVDRASDEVGHVEEACTNIRTSTGLELGLVQRYG